RHRGRDPKRHARGLRGLHREHGVLALPMMAAIVLVLIVAGLAFLMRSSGSKQDTIDLGSRTEPEVPDDVLEDSDADEGPDEEGFVQAAAVTSEGWAFVPRGRGLELIPPGEGDELLEDQAQRHGSDAMKQAMAMAPINPHTGKRLIFWR